jgi:hypothetical protein
MNLKKIGVLFSLLSAFSVFALEVAHSDLALGIPQ